MLTHPVLPNSTELKRIGFINNQTMKKDIAKMLKRAREIKGLTQAQLASKIKTSQSSVARAERGDTSLGDDFLEKIALAYKAKIIPPRFDFMTKDYLETIRLKPLEITTNDCFFLLGHMWCIDKLRKDHFTAYIFVCGAGLYDCEIVLDREFARLLNWLPRPTKEEIADKKRRDKLFKKTGNVRDLLSDTVGGLD